MTRLTRLCRALGVGLAVATTTLSLTQVANAEPAAPTNRQEIFVDPATNKVFLTAHAEPENLLSADGASGAGAVAGAALEPAR